MSQHRPESSEEATEERTEPFSQSEIDARFKGISVEEAGLATTGKAVPLDVLRVEDDQYKEGVRLLVRPLTNHGNTRSVSPGSDNCRWLALKAEVASSDEPEHKVLAVTQTAKDIKFSVRIPGETKDDLPRPPLWCELYYDPASDKVIFLNKSDVPLNLERVSLVHPASPGGNESHFIVPGLIKALRPGTWRISVGDVAVLDFRILEKRPVTVYAPQPTLSDASSPPPQNSDSAQSGSKRSLSPDTDNKRAVKRRISDTEAEAKDGVVMFFQPPANPLVFTLPSARETMELSAVNSQALLDAQQGETVVVPSVCELDEYQLTKREPIASTALSSVYNAKHSHIPNKIVTVKVLKTRVPNAQEKPQIHERNIIRQADMWLRESQSQEDLRHKSIVRYYGGDARYLSLYMEHVDAQDLTTATRWRSRTNDEFQGTRDDALRILADISSALNYLHERRMVHNDVKPANILYSRERGAVLCDFGLTTAATKPPSGGGTPYYVPPEYIGQELRGAPSDVWALGITLLYAMRKIALPDSRARRYHPKPLYWQIAGVNRPNVPFRHYGNGRPAVDQMREWLMEIREQRESLSSRDPLERLTKEMLTPNPSQRISMAKVAEELFVDKADAVR